MKKLTVILGLVLVMCLLVPVSCAAPPPAPMPAPAPAPIEEVIEITAQQLYSDYDANEIAADQKYKGKLLKVTGVINSIGTDILGDPYIVLTGGGEYEVWGVQCTFPNTKSWKDKIATMEKGETWHIKGKCTGYLINVLLEVD